MTDDAPFLLDVTRLIRISYGPFQLGSLPKRSVEEVPPKVLREQVGANRLLEILFPDRRPLRAQHGAKEFG